jgi:hypothetical protein
MPTRRTLILLVVILASHLGLLIHCALRSSICFDEGAHLAAGVAYLKFGDMSIYNLTPPLVSMWAAIPVVISGVDAPDVSQVRDFPDDLRHWAYFELFQQRNLAQLHHLVLEGRFMMIPLSLAGAIALFILSRRSYGDTAGLLSAAAWCFSPTVIAHASIVGTDIAPALTMFLACAAWMRFLRTRRTPDAMIAAVLIATAHLMKFTALLLWPALALVSAIEIYRRREKWRSILFPGAVAALGLTLILLNGIYGFRQFGPTLGSFQFVSRGMKTMQRSLPASLPLPFTRMMISGFDYQKFDTESGYIGTLFNQGYIGGDWRYYPWLVLTKSSLGGLILLALLAGSFFIRRPTPWEIDWLIILAVFWIFLTVVARINLGIRYLLPLYPPIILMMGRLAQIPKLRLASLLAAGLMLVETLIATPRFHRFVNLAAYPMRQWVPDQDWGQGLLDLRSWMDRHHVTTINLVYFGRVAPQAYGIEPAGLSPLPTTDYVAISQQMLCGYAPATRDGLVFVRAWRQLQTTRPVAELDGINVYQATDFSNLISPWIVRFQSREEEMRDPAIVPIRR